MMLLPTQRLSLSLPGLSRQITFVMIVLTLLACVLKQGGLLTIFWSDGNFFALLMLAVVVAIYLPRSLMHRRYHPGFWLAATILAALVAAQINFGLKSHFETNLNAIFAYFPLVTFVLFMRQEAPIDRTLTLLFWISAAYVAIYALAFPFLLSTAIEQGVQVSGLQDVERGARLAFAPGFAAFVFFYAWRRRSLNPLLRIAIMILPIVAILLSKYRTFLAIFLLIALFQGLRLMNPLTRLVLFGITLAGYLLILSGLFIPDWEPFGYFADDNSGFARLLQYRHILPFLKSYWLEGVGVSSSTLVFETYMRVPTTFAVYPTDLGPVGVLLVFGLPGLLVYFLMTYLMIVPAIPPPVTAARQALQLTCIVLGVQGIISPSFMMEGNALFFALLVSLWIQSRDGTSSQRDLFTYLSMVQRRDMDVMEPTPMPLTYPAMPEADDRAGG